MTITGVITAILIGIVVGVLGRLLVPGKQPIGMLVTILVGIVSAFIGTAIARALGIPTVTNGIDWLELLVQVIVAALGVALVSALMGRRRTGLMGGRRSGLSADRTLRRSRLDPRQPGLSCLVSAGDHGVVGRGLDLLHRPRRLPSGSGDTRTACPPVADRR